jgi:Chaperone of endosialidase
MRSRGLFLILVCLSLVPLTLAQTSTQAATSADRSQVSAPPATITGSGTTNFIPRWTGSSTLGNSKIYQTSLGLGVGNTDPQVELDVTGRINTSTSYRIVDADVLTMPGGLNLGNIAVGYEAFVNNDGGTSNTAIGFNALQFNTTGFENTASGAYALQSNTTGSENTACAEFALMSNTTGFGNTASGNAAMEFNTTGNGNTADGYQALVGVTGSYNIGVGYQSAENLNRGSSNIAIGYRAANNVSGANSNNVHIASEGVSSDSGVIRIGTAGTQTSFFAAGIYGVSSGSNSAVPVLIDSSGQLVTVSSSRRYKEDIQDMGDASRGLMQLRPVTFRYKKPIADGSQPMQYGLIAEEVAEVYPDLVTHSADGQIETVKYQVLNSMLLNEVQRQQTEIRNLQERLSQIESALASVHSTAEVRQK